MSNPGTAQNNRLISFYQRHEAIQSDIDERNADKKELYAEMKGVGFDTDAFKAVIKRIRAEEKNPAKVQESDYLQELYLNAIKGNSGIDTGPKLDNARACTRTEMKINLPPSAKIAPATTKTPPHDPETGEVIAAPKPASPAEMPDLPDILKRGHPDCIVKGD